MPKPPPDVVHFQTSLDLPTDQSDEAERAAKIRAVEEGLADADAGRVVGYGKVKAWLRSWGTNNELPPPSVPDTDS